MNYNNVAVFLYVSVLKHITESARTQARFCLTPLSSGRAPRQANYQVQQQQQQLRRVAYCLVADILGRASLQLSLLYTSTPFLPVSLPVHFINPFTTRPLVRR